MPRLLEFKEEIERCVSKMNAVEQETGLIIPDIKGYQVYSEGTASINALEAPLLFCDVCNVK